MSPSLPRPPATRRRPPALRRDLRIIFVEVATWGFMMGWGQEYLTPLALALGVSESLSGLVYTLPFLLGALMQLAVPALVRRIGSFRPSVVVLTLLQTASLALLALGAAIGHLPYALLLFLIAVYWGSGIGSGPAWMTWMDTLIPRPVRARYFARRTVLGRVTMGLSLLASGAVLEYATAQDQRLQGFALLMGIAAFARLVSSGLMWLQSDIPAAADEVRDVPVTALFSRKRTAQDGRLLTFVLVLLGTQAVAAPLLPALMLEQRHVGYLAWSWIAAAPFLARVLALPVIGRVAATRGPAAILAGGAALGAVVPLLWTVPGGVPYYLLVGLIAGSGEAAFSLGSFLMIFETVRREERCSVMATFSVAMGLSMVVGSGFGGGLLRFLGEDASAYTAVYAVAALAQLAALGLLRRSLTAETS